MAENDGIDKAVENSTALIASEETPTEVKVAALDDFVQLMKGDLDLRAKEMSLREKELDNGHEYSKNALAAQVQDRKETREGSKIARRDYLLAGGFAFLVIVIFLSVCIYTGNADIAKQIVYFGGTALVSGVSGYFIGKQKAGKNSSSKETE